MAQSNGGFYNGKNMKKITMQDVADALGISRVTVWKVFSNREGVSDDLKLKIVQKAMEMNYQVPEELKLPEVIKDQNKEQITISVTVSRPETSMFWMTIIHEAAKEMAKLNINLMYTYLPSVIPDSYTLPPALSNGTIQGMIVLNIYDEKIMQMLSNLSIPKVFMDTVTNVPFEKLNGDLILIEGKSYIFEITEHLIQSGRSKIGFIGDIGYAYTNNDRYHGFLHAMKKHGLSVNPKHSLTRTLGIDTYTEEIREFIDSLTSLPEAFICANDYIANILFKIFEEKGIQVPKDIALSGFDDNLEFPETSKLTTVKVHTKSLGARLAMQLLYRINNPEAGYELSYIHSNVIYRKSTDIAKK